MNCIFCGRSLTGGIDTFGPIGMEFCGSAECHAKAVKDEQLMAASPTAYDMTHANIILGYTGDLGLAMKTASYHGPIYGQRIGRKP